LRYLRLRHWRQANGRISVAPIISEHAMALRGLASVGLLTDKMVVSATAGSHRLGTRDQDPRYRIMPNAGSFTYWYLQLPNLILTAMLLLLLARLVLAPMLGLNASILRPVVAITQPVVVTVGAVTPRVVPPAGVVACSIVWLMAARTVLFMAAQIMGVRL
jgi:hypothetical protein